MSQRKSWTKMEDKVLKLLREQKGYKKWSEVAEIMRSQYGIEGRNGKQCRERYHNHLDERISKLEWTPQEDEDLLILHNLHGNRWAVIARQIKGRTDNCVKNRFYSRFRRSIRNVNEFIKIFWKKQFKQLKPTFISKSLDQPQMQIKKKFSTLAKVFKWDNSDLKCRLMSFSDSTQDQLKSNQQRLNQLHQLIKQINAFNRKNKRKGKKKKKQSEDEDDYEDVWSEQKGKSKIQKNKKDSQQKHIIKLDKVKKEDIAVKEQEQDFVEKIYMNNLQKPVLQKNIDVETQNMSSNRMQIEEGRPLHPIKLELELEQFQFKKKYDTYGSINQKIQQGFDINEFYSLENLRDPVHQYFY